MQLPLTFIPYSVFTDTKLGMIKDAGDNVICNHIKSEHAQVFMDLAQDAHDHQQFVKAMKERSDAMADELMKDLHKKSPIGRCLTKNINMEKPAKPGPDYSQGY